jgi:hypothetical protein
MVSTMTDHLSFADVSLLTENIAEITVHPNVEITLDMVEECNQFFEQQFSGFFALLINKINLYDYSFEAKVSVVAHEKLAAIAVVTYDNRGRSVTHNIWCLQQKNGFKLQLFDGVDSGWLKGYKWLKSELKPLESLDLQEDLVSGFSPELMQLTTTG